MLLLFKVGFFDLTLLDALDVLIVGYLLYRIYKLLRGSIGFNMLIGLALVFLIWSSVRQLNMTLLTLILNTVLNVGVIALLIVFQPEVRRFLLLIGKNTFGQRFSMRLLLRKAFFPNANSGTMDAETAKQITLAIKRLSATKQGALLVFIAEAGMQTIIDNGVRIEAAISAPLLESIFNKESPLHDGAALMTQSRVLAASCILPVSESEEIPQNKGLRHRAAVGVTENNNCLAVIVSEETGAICYASEGKLSPPQTLENITAILQQTLMLP